MLILVAILGFLLLLPLRVYAASPTPEEMDDAGRWSAAKFSGATPDLPFSFVYGGRSSRELLGSWAVEDAEETLFVHAGPSFALELLNINFKDADGRTEAVSGPFRYVHRGEDP